MKCAGVYKRKGNLYFNSSSQTTVGVWIATEPYLSTRDDDEPAVKGRRLREALLASKQVVPHPPQNEWGRVVEPLLRLAGVKSWGTFAKLAKACSVRLEGEEVRFIPYKYMGPREGYDALRSRTITVAFDVSDEELAAILDKALEACE